MPKPNPAKDAAARLAYAADVRDLPTYHDGTPRKRWEDLSPLARWSWERNPTPRHGAASLEGGAP